MLEHFRLSEFIYQNSLVCFYSNPLLSRKRVSSKNHKRSRANSHGDKRGGLFPVGNKFFHFTHC